MIHNEKYFMSLDKTRKQKIEEALMNSKITNELLNRVVEMPVGLQERTQASIKKCQIYEALKVIKTGQAITYSIPEFEKEFGRYGISSLIAFLKKKGLKKPAIKKLDDKIYIFNRTEV